MRHLFLTTTMTMTLLTSDLQTANPKEKALPTDVGPGRIAWFDITTTNLVQSKDFYGKLFDWRFTTVQNSDQATEIVTGDTAIGTLRTADEKISPHSDVVYVQMSDIQSSYKKSKELGDTIPPGFPFNLPTGIGAIAMVIDPIGHAIGMYSRTPIPPKQTSAK